ncbi:MAG: hypothetical protein JNK05_23050 [Myxococcales bacterium]|nr:hypothetical protein [Myxococcales bacterium]
MSDAYRDEHEAALRHLDALRRENAELRERLSQQETDAQPREAPSTGASRGAALVLIAGVFFLAGSVTIAGASRGRHGDGYARRPCPYAARGGEGAFARGERLLRAEPGQIRVELARGNETARVRVDGMEVPRSGAIALSGPLAGGATHVVDVSEGGFIQSRSRVWVTPGRTEVVRVALAIDPSPKQGEEDKLDDESR